MDICTSDRSRVGPGDLDLLPEEELGLLVAVTKALADPIRLQMLALLGQRPDLCTCEFEAVLGLGQSKVSYHLKLLLDARLVTREVYGTWSHYRLTRHDVLLHLHTLVGTVPHA